jgi:hypothetical protein
MYRESPDSAPVFDLQPLLERCVGNFDLAERFLAKFCERFDDELLQRDQVVQAEDAETIERLACKSR